jgi:hypothetical protein
MFEHGAFSSFKIANRPHQLDSALVGGRSGPHFAVNRFGAQLRMISE